ncbi:hypothetical protein RRG08_006275 [Elysia crispata]|uniref:Uncharacterized protein n=1 Tax=Elysia crispata TaxID=231223 RepID=A0AAE0YQ11_9GAST|nr:hypothetical protein RRG08_006275 [Elysia crispata]
MIGKTLIRTYDPVVSANSPDEFCDNYFFFLSQPAPGSTPGLPPRNGVVYYFVSPDCAIVITCSLLTPTSLTQTTRNSVECCRESLNTMAAVLDGRCLSSGQEVSKHRGTGFQYSQTWTNFSLSLMCVNV